MTRTSFFIVMSCYCRDSVDNDGKYASSKNVYVKLLLQYTYRTLARTYSWNSSLQETSHYLTSTIVDWHSCGINKLVFYFILFLFFYYFCFKELPTYFMRNMNSVTTAASRDWERRLGRRCCTTTIIILYRHQLLYQTTVLIAIPLSLSHQ